MKPTCTTNWLASRIHAERMVIPHARFTELFGPGEDRGKHSASRKISVQHFFCMFTKHENPETGEERCEGVEVTRLESPLGAEEGMTKPSPKAHAYDGIYLVRAMVHNRLVVNVRIQAGKT
jgi:hypothetical protein